MKFDFNRRYNTIAAYAVLVVAISAILVVAINNYRGIWKFLAEISSLLTPFIIGFAIAYIINPILNVIEHRIIGPLSGGKISQRMNRVISLILTYIFTIVIVVIFFRIVIPQIALSIASLAAQVPGWIVKAEALINELIVAYDLRNIDPKVFDQMVEPLKDLIGTTYSLVTNAIPQVWQATLTVTTSVFNVILGIIISVYILLGKERFFAQIKKILNAFFPSEAVQKIVEITHQSHEIFSGFISGKILDSCIIGVLCFIFLWIFRFPYAMLISVIVGVTNVIPYFGPFIGAIPSILIMLIVDPVKAIWLALFILALQQLDGNVIGPKILGDSTGLNAFWVIFSITVFSSTLGLVGMFIGVPLFAVIYSLIRQFAEWRLSLKGMPTDTVAYASHDHPLLEKPSALKEKRRKKKEK